MSVQFSFIFAHLFFSSHTLSCLCVPCNSGAPEMLDLIGSDTANSVLQFSDGFCDIHHGFMGG